MNGHAKHKPPQDIVNALDASVRDIAAGSVPDAEGVQVKARRLFNDIEADGGASHAAGDRHAAFTCLKRF